MWICWFSRLPINTFFKSITVYNIFSQTWQIYEYVSPIIKQNYILEPYFG